MRHRGPREGVWGVFLRAPPCFWGHPPVFEGVVDDGFEHQAVPDLRRPAEVEHLDGAQRGVGMAQPAAGWGLSHGTHTPAPRTPLPSTARAGGPVRAVSSPFPTPRVPTPLALCRAPSLPPCRLPGVPSTHLQPPPQAPGGDGGHVLHPGHDLPAEGVALVVGVRGQHQLHALHPRLLGRHHHAAVPRLQLCSGGTPGGLSATAAPAPGTPIPSAPPRGGDARYRCCGGCG